MDDIHGRRHVAAANPQDQVDRGPQPPAAELLRRIGGAQVPADRQRSRDAIALLPVASTMIASCVSGLMRTLELMAGSFAPS